MQPAGLLGVELDVGRLAQPAWRCAAIFASEVVGEFIGTYILVLTVGCNVRKQRALRRALRASLPRRIYEAMEFAFFQVVAELAARFSSGTV